MSAGPLGPILAGVQMLLERLTAARADLIDTIATNAATLVSRLTATRAAYIDAIKASTDASLLDTDALEQRLTPTRAAALDAIVRIKSIQRGEVSLATDAYTGTATIAAVDPAKALLIFHGASVVTSLVGPATVRVSLTNATTVTATRGVTGGAATAGFAVLEFY